MGVRFSGGCTLKRPRFSGVYRGGPALVGTLKRPRFGGVHRSGPALVVYTEAAPLWWECALVVGLHRSGPALVQRRARFGVSAPWWYYTEAECALVYKPTQAHSALVYTRALRLGVLTTNATLVQSGTCFGGMYRSALRLGRSSKRTPPWWVAQTECALVGILRLNALRCGKKPALILMQRVGQCRSSESAKTDLVKRVGESRLTTG